MNWCGLVSALLIFVSLFLPWLSATFYQLVGAFPNVTRDYSLHAGLSINYFGIIGYANAITRVLLFPYWFNWFFSGILFIAGLLAVRGSLAKRTTGRKLMVLAAILAIVCSPMFYLAFTLTVLSQPLTSNNMLFTFFTPSNFGPSTMDVSSLHTRIENLSFYWLPVVAGILAIVSRKFFTD